jgi:SsrA-binding protein
MADLSTNKQAFFDYEILKKFEAGLILHGFEVKSVRLGRASLRSSFIFFKNGEAYLNNTNIPNYQALNTPKDYNPNRIRKVLLSKKEIIDLYNSTKEKGLTLIPLRLYTKGDKIKVEVALVKGKKKFDKRDSIKRRDVKREIDRATKKRG